MPTGDRNAKTYRVLMHRGSHRGIAAACSHFHLPTQPFLPYLQHGSALNTDIRHSGAIRNLRWTSTLQINKLTSPHFPGRGEDFHRLHSPGHRQMPQQAVLAQLLQWFSSPYPPKKPNIWNFIAVVHLLSSPIIGFVPISHKCGSQTEGWRLVKI